jgi:hypothetical protein
MLHFSWATQWMPLPGSIMGISFLFSSAQENTTANYQQSGCEGFRFSGKFTGGSTGKFALPLTFCEIFV